MIGCLRTCVRKQPIVALYFKFETELKVYNLENLVFFLFSNSLHACLGILHTFSSLLIFFSKLTIQNIGHDLDPNC